MLILNVCFERSRQNARFFPAKISFERSRQNAQFFPAKISFECLRRNARFFPAKKRRLFFCAHFYASAAPTSPVWLTVCKALAPKGFCSTHPPK